MALLVHCLLSPHGGLRSGCGHSDDVGVVCTNEDLPDEDEWMWVSRRGFQCKSYSVTLCISVPKGLCDLQNISSY